MIEPTAAQLAAIYIHATACEPHECCGALADGTYFPLRNAETVFDRFALDMRDFHKLQQSTKIEAIVHSHVGHGPMASETDRAACDRIGLPFVILSWPAGTWTAIEPRPGLAPLVGRQWQWGVHDCFSLVRDALDAHGDIRLPDYDRDWQFWERGEDLVGQAIEGSGFVVLPPGSQPQHLDLFGMRMPGSPVVNHLAVFLAPDLILHQLAGRLSVRELYSGFFQRLTVLHLRHERFMRAPPA